MNLKILFLLILLASPLLLAHEGEDEAAGLDLRHYNRGDFVYAPMAAAALAVLAISVASILLENKLDESGKQIAFFSIAGVILAATAYLVFSVASIMLDSETKGPVHWHADFEVWACGEKLELKKAAGFSSRVGPLLLHHHGDNRIHVEGILRRRGDVRLSNFFVAIAPEQGGRFTQDEIAVVLSDGRLASFHNGDLCPDGKAGAVKLFVNGAPEASMGDYVLSPHTDVPPGDVIKIVFGSS